MFFLGGVSKVLIFPEVVEISLPVILEPLHFSPSFFLFLCCAPINDLFHHIVRMNDAQQVNKHQPKVIGVKFI